MAASRLGLTALVLVACGSPQPSAVPGEVTPTASAAPRVIPVSAATAEAPASAPSAESPKPPEAAPAPAAVPFPPPDFAPPSAKSAVDGDGKWTALGDTQKKEHAATTPPVIVRTVVHPHPASRFVTATVAAVDLSRIGLKLVPGTEDLAWSKQPVTPGSGLVPQADQGALAFVMNGGFQPKHGKWGLMAESGVITEPRVEGCTLAIYRDGSVRIAPWPRLAETRANMVAYRQTPPCLVDEGAVHPNLLKGNDKAWAGHVADVKTQRRSAVGIDASGRILFYALGEETEARHLADALRAAGAAVAAELDINWYWTRFLLFGETPAGLRITTTLIPKTEHQPHGYVVRASTRDFFYGVLK